jgi:hypothetical protein
VFGNEQTRPWMAATLLDVTPPATAEPAWSTSSFGGAAGASTVELRALREHAAGCRGSHMGLLALQCGAEAMAGFVAARQVTTLAILAALLGVASWFASWFASWWWA